MLIKRLLFAVLLPLMVISPVLAQIESQEIDPEDFDADALIGLIIEGLNAYRSENKLDSLMEHNILGQAANLQANYMVEAKKKTLDQDKGKYKTTAKRMEEFGGTANATEIVANAAVGKRKQNYTYGQVVGDLMKAVTKSRKNQKLLDDPKLFYYGIAIGYDAEKLKVYMSMVLGGVDAINPGEQYRKSLPVKYSKGGKGYKPWSKRDCRKVDKFTNIHELQSGMYLSDNKVFLEYDNYKKLFKTLRGKSDGLGVEIIQKDQYQCGRDNVVDNTLFNQGILLKPTKLKKLEKKNLVEDVKGENRYQGMIGKIPKGKLKKLGNDYEMNLVIMLNKAYCRSIYRTYLEEGGESAVTPLTVYPDTITADDPKRYRLSAENNEVLFEVPFDVAKFNYERKDIEPLIKSLNEPKYEINKVNIIAHSSIEGDSLQNDMLQKKRAESIVDAISSIQGKEVIGEIQTNDSYELFREQVKGTEWSSWASLSKTEIRAKLREDGNLKKLEPLLQKQRFAKITMYVKYDIKGENEQPFILSSIRKAIEKGDAEQALRIQKFAISKILSKQYDAQPFIDMEIPNEPPYSSLKVNQIFLDTYVNHKNKIFPALVEKFGQLYAVAPEKDHVKFNKQLMFVKFEDLVDDAMVNDMQSKINAMYSSKVPQHIMDALNLEYQFKVIEYADTNEFEEGPVSPLVEQSLEKVKKIFKIEEANWQNALKLGYIFMKFGDLEYALKAMKPFIEDEATLDPELAFAYISVATHFPEEIYSRELRMALAVAAEKDTDKYCELFGDPYMSIQVLQHPLIKQNYCEICEGFGGGGGGGDDGGDDDGGFDE